MKFRLLLYILFKKLRKASKSNIAFKNYVKNKKLRLLIKTADGKISRMYVIGNGEVSSPGGDQNGYDVAMVWADAASGFKAMASDNDADTMIAWKEGKLKVDGNANLLMWFTGAAKIMMKK
jgi:hypothetical protein